MSIEEAVVTRLQAWPALLDVADKIFPLAAPQTDSDHLAVRAPFLIYQRISGERFRSLSGPSGLARPRLQIDTYAPTYASCLALADQVRAALDGFIGVSGGVQIRASYLDNDLDIFEDGVDPRLYRRAQDFIFHHDE